jgi:hypothetical protein
MSVPSDVVPATPPPLFPPAPYAEPAFDRVDEDDEATRVFREINARRAQVENPEMLRRLRGL